MKYTSGAEINSDPFPDPSFDTLVWSDEFDGNGAIDGSKWHHQTQLIAGDSWANNEKQHYTNRTTNSYVNNGTLKIVAREESYTDQGVTKQYTSARLNSKYAFQNGRVEVRAKLPSFAGTWPAIWMIPMYNAYGGWPDSGEIDYRSVFKAIASIGWDAPLGAEYKPGGDTDATLEWMQTLDCRV